MRILVTLVVVLGWVTLGLWPWVDVGGGTVLRGSASTLSGMLRVATEFPLMPGTTLAVRSIAYGLVTLCAVLAGVMALLLAWRASRANPSARYLLGFLAPLPLALGVEYFLMPLEVVAFTGDWLGALASGTAFAVAVVSLPRFAFSFPSRMTDEQLRSGWEAHTQLPPRWRRWSRRDQPVSGANTTELRFVERQLNNGVFLSLLAPALVAARLSDDVYFGLLLIVSIAFSVMYSWVALDVQRRGPEGRRVTWLLGGVWLAIASWVLLGTVLFALSPFVGELGWNAYIAGLLGLGPFVALSVMLGGCGLAVLHSGDVDPGPVLRRTTVTAAAAILLLFMFGAIETVVSDVILSALRLPEGLGSVIAGGFIAIAFKPAQDIAAKHTPKWGKASETRTVDNAV